MTHKYISTQMLIIFTALMIIANFYYIFFEKIGFLLVLLLGCVLVYVGYLYFHKIRGLLAFWIGALLIAFTLLSNTDYLLEKACERKGIPFEPKEIDNEAEIQAKQVLIDRANRQKKSR